MARLSVQELLTILGLPAIANSQTGTSGFIMTSMFRNHIQDLLTEMCTIHREDRTSCCNLRLVGFFRLAETRAIVLSTGLTARTGLSAASVTCSWS
jgi:hypothetical protein